MKIAYTNHFSRGQIAAFLFTFSILLFPGRVFSETTLKGIDPFSPVPLQDQWRSLALNDSEVPAESEQPLPDVYKSQEKESDGLSRKSQIKLHRIAGLTTLALWFATNLAGEEALEHLEPDMDQSSILAYGLNPSNNLPLFLAMRMDQPALLLWNSTSNQDLAEKYMIYKSFRDSAEWESSAGSTHLTLAGATLAAYTVTAVLALTADDDGMSHTASSDGGVDSVFLHRNLAWVHLAALVAMPILGHSLEENGPENGRIKQNVAWAGFLTLSVAAVTVSF